MKKVLVPYDFSEHAKYALDAAVQWCKITHAKMEILHILELPSGFIGLANEFGAFDPGTVYNPEVIKRVRDRLEEIKSNVQKEGIVVQIKIVNGTPLGGISGAITEEPCDMIIMGSRGASGLKEIFIGSNTERVIRHSPVPVMTIKEPTDFYGITDMVYATDFTMNKSIDTLRSIQRILRLHIHVVKVYNTNRWSYTHESARRNLEEFAMNVGLTDYTVHAVDASFVEEGILEYAHKHNLGLIVMGTHQHTGIGHLIAGSVAEAVANHSKVPVLTTQM